MLPAMANVPDEKADELCSIIRRLFALTDSLLPDRRPQLTQSLTELCSQTEKHPAVFGAAMGLLCAVDLSNQFAAERAMRGFLRGTAEIKKQGAEYLKGLFSTARDIVFSGDDFLLMTDELLRSMTSGDFIEILPSLKLAFSYFTPQEIDETAEAIAALYDADAGAILDDAAIDEQLYSFGRQLDIEITQKLGGEHH